MAAVLEPVKPPSAEQQVIRRLNSSAYRAAGSDGLLPGRVNTPFAKFNPQARPPAEHAALAPLRDDVPLLDPCCGQLSAGAEVDLAVKGRQRFIDVGHVASALRVPAGLRERPQTPRNPAALCCDPAQDKAWNCRRVPEAAVRASLGGWTSPVKVKPESHRLTASVTFPSFFLETDTGSQEACSSDAREWTDHTRAVRRFVYTSTTQRSYEEVGWDAKLPRRLRAPDTTLEKMADPVNQRSSCRRYHSQPQLWQSIGTEWNRLQLRSRSDARKPVSFCSRCSRSGQIPLYSGTIGSENMDNIDNMDEDFHPLTLLRNTIPPYTPTARRTTIPGYTGKAAYANSAADAAVSIPALSIPAHSSGTNRGSGSGVSGRAAPLSRMVTTAAPWNPFLHPKTHGT
ncbi:protein SPMIP7 [Centroberyx affinis]|uniref:protein SPMIP7 n=1 Tax=Centroberyx affinis TaxID=166261 RepID=UPI003A5BE44B